MLKKNARVVVDGEIVVNDVSAARCYATIDLDNPKNVNLTTRQINGDVRIENRTELQAGVAEFEDYTYGLRDKILASVKTN